MRWVSRRSAAVRRFGLTRAFFLGDADGIVVVKLDRLSRSTRHILDLLEASQKGRWRLLSVEESLPPRSQP